MKSYVTLLSTENYYYGVLVLYRSLLKVKSKYSLICLLSQNIRKEVENNLKHEGIICIRLNDQTITETTNPENERFSNWNYTFDKLRIWGLTQFEKLIFLDSDMLVCKNLDHLFECEPFSGVIAGKSFPGHENWLDINSGLMVIKPNKEIEQKLLKLLPSVVETFKSQKRFVGDQDVLQSFLSEDWRNNSNLHLEEGYNIFADFLTYYIRKLGYSFNNKNKKTIYVIHFIGKYKPWMKPNIKEVMWIIKMCIKNPYYLYAYYTFRNYM